MRRARAVGFLLAWRLPMARAMWRAVLRIGERALPVKLYSAVEDQDVHFHLVHAPDGVRVVQRMLNPSTGEVVANDQITRALELERGTFVEISAEEKAALAPKPSRDITVSKLFERGAIAPHWFDRPYYLGPDGAIREYAALTKELERSGRDALARWVMRGRSHAGLLHARDHGLCLITLHSQGEMVEAAVPAATEGRPADARELALAEQLVEALRGELDLAQFRDEHRARILELIERKARGERVSRRTVSKSETKVSSLSVQLRASLRSARTKERRSA